MTLAFTFGAIALVSIVFTFALMRSTARREDQATKLTREELMKVNQVVRPSSEPMDTKEVDQ